MALEEGGCGQKREIGSPDDCQQLRTELDRAGERNQLGQSSAGERGQSGPEPKDLFRLEREVRTDGDQFMWLVYLMERCVLGEET
jgi:hypothetical protein